MAKKSIWGVGLAGAGMVALLGGKKKTGLSLFARGCAILEKEWRAAHPDFNGNLADRWQLAIDFYKSTHENQTNRWLHITGIPLITAGAAGLLAFRPFRPAWNISAGSFAVGWVLNFIGHGVFEKKAPAFRDDPLSFIAGPVWDFQQIFGKKAAAAPEDVDAVPAPNAESNDEAPVSGFTAAHLDQA